MQTCVDELLRLQFKVPAAWGDIRARLAKGGDSGLKYAYSFGAPGAAQAGGDSRDFSEGRERFWTDFWGFNGHSPLEVCGWFSSPYSCEVIQPNVILIYLYPSADSVCDPGPGSVYSPMTVLAIDLPENEQINGFVFVDGLLSQAGQVELDQAYRALGGASEIPFYQGCDESRMAAFDAYIQGLIERIKQNDVDRDTLNIIDSWHRIATSIKLVKVK